MYEPKGNIFFDATLRQSAKWGKRLAVCACALLVLVALTGLAGILYFFTLPVHEKPFSALYPAVIGGSVLSILAFYAYPLWSLYRASVELERASLESDPELLVKAFRHQRNLFRYGAVVVGVVVALYGLGWLAWLGYLFGLG